MQCNVKGDETERLNHMRQNVEDHQQRERQRGYATHCCQASWKWKSPSKNTTAMVSWSAYHGERQKRVNARCQSSLVSLFAEAAHSIAMIKHAIIIDMKAVEHLNPGQTTVIAFRSTPICFS